MDIYTPQDAFGMKVHKVSYLLFVCLSTVTLVLSADPNALQSHLNSDFQNSILNFDLTTMQDLLNAIGKTLDFYEKELDKLDADALLGLRVGEGKLEDQKLPQLLCTCRGNPAKCGYCHQIPHIAPGTSNMLMNMIYIILNPVRARSSNCAT